MRAFIVIPLCLAAAACSGGSDEKKAEAPDTMQAGQWEISSEVSAFRSADKAVPALKAAVGDKSATQACIEAGKEDKPPAALFAGAGYECGYKDTYISGGRINVGMECERDGLDGKVMVAVEGNYTADGFQGTATSKSLLPGDGDFEMTSKISGRRTGPACAAPQAANSKGKAGD